MENETALAGQKKFARVAPHLPVANLQITLRYYKEKLGFTDEWTYGEKDGGIRRDELRLLFCGGQRIHKRY